MKIRNPMTGEPIDVVVDPTMGHDEMRLVAAPPPIPKPLHEVTFGDLRCPLCFSAFKDISHSLRVAPWSELPGFKTQDTFGHCDNGHSIRVSVTGDGFLDVGLADA